MFSPPVIAFGTSGLRGPAEGFSQAVVGAYVTAFLQTACAGPGARRVYVGGDFRSSTPIIVRSCVNAIAAAGWEPVYAGCVPTPALAAFALSERCPAIMVTGSHIPEQFNGIKFYRRDGELLKSDEEPLLLAAGVGADEVTYVERALPPVDKAIARRYRDRFVSAFSADCLGGLRMGVDLHSAVGGDLLVEVLTALGARCFAFGREDVFVAVDTEAVEPMRLERAMAEIQKHQLDCVVSTDGDGDRPLLIDANGRQINGDVLGALTARFLGIDRIVTPQTSTTAIEQSGWFQTVKRTKVGSPYVVAEMAALGRAGGPVAGFEANGGFLLGSDLDLPSGRLTKLPTRDGLLPLIAVMAFAKASGQSLAQLAAQLPARVMRSGLVKDVPAVRAEEMLRAMAGSAGARKRLDVRLETPTAIDQLDGVRLTFSDDAIVHFRRSGNAPELRCYVEMTDIGQTEGLLHDVLAGLRSELTPGG